jgi:hypothetical protein
MTNPERGEATLTIGGREYTLKLSMNACVALERRLKKSIGDILAEAGRLNFEAIRLAVWLLLQKHHSADFKTEEAAGTLMDEAGGISMFFTALQQLQEANRPEGESGEPGNPPTAQGASTGGGSTSTPDASA